MATTIYNTVFTTTLTKWTARLVPKAVIAAGLPESKVSDVIKAMQSSDFAKAYSPDVVAAATMASKEATCKAVL